MPLNWKYRLKKYLWEIKCDKKICNNNFIKSLIKNLFWQCFKKLNISYLISNWKMKIISNSFISSNTSNILGEFRHIWSERSGQIDLLRREEKQEGGCPSRVNGETRTHVQGYVLNHQLPIRRRLQEPWRRTKISDQHPRLALTWPRHGHTRRTFRGKKKDEGNNNNHGPSGTSRSCAKYHSWCTQMTNHSYG